MHGQRRGGSGDINKEDEEFFVLAKEIFLTLDLSFTREKEFPIKNPLEIINMKGKIFLKTLSVAYFYLLPLCSNFGLSVASFPPSPSSIAPFAKQKTFLCFRLFTGGGGRGGWGSRLLLHACPKKS